MPYLVNEYPHHITLTTLQRSESTSKVELNVVLLAFHTHSQEDTPVCIEIEPYVMHKEVPEPLRIKADIFSPDRVMLTDQRTVANAGHQPEGFLYRYVKGLVPYEPQGKLLTEL
jgi:hypothetical protein